MGELGNELVRHAVGEVILRGVAGQIVKREDGKRADGGRGVETTGEQPRRRSEDEEAGSENGCEAEATT